MSGRANIFLRSAVLGRRRKDVERDIDEIIDYTQLRDAIDAPVSTYSAGMRMRLAFATTIFMRPDLLLVDEVLSVGDFRFRQKCLESIRRMRENAGFVLVSHSMGDISRFCDRVMVLDGGKVAFAGAPNDAIRFYYDEQEKTAAPKRPVKASIFGEFINKDHEIRAVKAHWAGAATSGGAVRLSLRFTLETSPRNLIVGVPIYGQDGNLLTALSSEQMQMGFDHSVGREVEIEIEIPELMLAPGVYPAVLAIVDGPEFLYRQPIDDLVVTTGSLPKYWGSFVLPHRWKTSGRA